MLNKRLSSALSSGDLVLPDGPVLVFGSSEQLNSDGYAVGPQSAVQPFFPEFEMLGAAGVSVCPDAEQAGDGFAVAVVAVPRARARARLWISQAASALGPGGLLVVDGAKVDGIDSLYKSLRPMMTDTGTLTKAHGRMFWGHPGADLVDQAPKETQQVVRGGFVTAPGVFSAEGPDAGSEALAAALGADLKGRVADLGAGWGYLSARILESPGVQQLHLVEADHMALQAARRNIFDPRAQFHWADATRWKADEPLDTVVMNPPFHKGREGDPGIGHAFIENAARNLRRSGQLWLVANRHLPYERVLNGCFRTVDEMQGTPAFKVFRARGPRST